MWFPCVTTGALLVEDLLSGCSHAESEKVRASAARGMRRESGCLPIISRAAVAGVIVLLDVAIDA